MQTSQPKAGADQPPGHNAFSTNPLHEFSVEVVLMALNCGKGVEWCTGERSVWLGRDSERRVVVE